MSVPNENDGDKLKAINNLSLSKPAFSKLQNTELQHLNEEIEEIIPSERSINSIMPNFEC